MIKKIYKKFFYRPSIKFSFFSVCSINMLNINQNNKIENINKEICLLQDRLEINKKSLNQSKNRLMQFRE